MNANISKHITLVKDARPVKGLLPSEVAAEISKSTKFTIVAVASPSVSPKDAKFDLNFRVFDPISAGDLATLKHSTTIALNRIRKKAA